jgi:hypothetical protein
MEEVIIGLLAGVMFQCAGDDLGETFEVFAPDAEATAGYRGDVRTLYAFDGAGMGVEAPGYEQILDMLPDSLMLSWRVTNNSPVELSISDYDPAARSANFFMTYETNPNARASTRTETHGVCRVLPVQEGTPT